MFQLSKKSASFFGIDLGTTGIKVVHLAYENDRVTLKNYVSLEAEKKINPDGSITKRNIQALDQDTTESMQTIIESAGVANNKVAMSVPASSTFSSIITLPKMPEDQIENAVNYEARQYIPISVDEVVFGWSVISGSGKDKIVLKSGKHAGKKEERKAAPMSSSGGEKTRVLLIAIPKEISAKYMKIANEFNLDLIALETESFSLARSLVGKKEGVFVVIDLGYKMTSITIIDDGLVTESHSISSVGGEEFTKVISHSFGVNEKRADVLKKEIGISPSATDKKVYEVISPILSIVVSEVKKNEEAYMRTNGKKINGVVLTGGSSLMPGLGEYIANELKIPVEMGNPFKMISYNKILDDKLEKIAPHYAVAVGLALYGFEDK
ncbi:MAG: pilus assembly protein PilM [Candidatus Pacebacteria bacterium]|nr:pilus assembly protein PilM [Candidatus Paceibacterota bacterium]